MRFRNDSYVANRRYDVPTPADMLVQQFGESTDDKGC